MSKPLDIAAARKAGRNKIAQIRDDLTDLINILSDTRDERCLKAAASLREAKTEVFIAHSWLKPSDDDEPTPTPDRG